MGRKRKHPGAQVQKYIKCFDDIDQVSEDWYVVRDGVRFVRPYLFNFRVNCKARWKGETILDVFTDEFGHKGRDYWEREITTGRLLCCDRNVRPDEALDGSEWFTHTVHRHETPVLDAPISKVFESAEVFVVVKPASMPVHPCGTYRRNSLTFLAALKYQQYDLRTVHRLDKCTSGLVIFAKSKEAAQRLSAEVSGRTVRKEYLALVNGRVPSEDLACSESLSFDPRQQIGSCDSDGKDAHTDFRLVAWNEERQISLVRCYPKTGRTHQIRIHLKALGHPICNDTKYASEIRTLEPEGNLISSYKPPPVPEDALGEGVRMGCETCPSFLPIFANDEPVQLYLHAERYSGDGWDYYAPAPAWATAILNAQPKSS